MTTKNELFEDAELLARDTAVTIRDEVTAQALLEEVLSSWPTRDIVSVVLEAAPEAFEEMPSGKRSIIRELADHLAFALADGLAAASRKR